MSNYIMSESQRGMATISNIGEENVKKYFDDTLKTNPTFKELARYNTLEEAYIGYNNYIDNMLSVLTEKINKLLSNPIYNNDIEKKSKKIKDNTIQKNKGEYIVAYSMLLEQCYILIPQSVEKDATLYNNGIKDGSLEIISQDNSYTQAILDFNKKTFEIIKKLQNETTNINELRLQRNQIFEVLLRKEDIDFDNISKKQAKTKKVKYPKI